MSQAQITLEKFFDVWVLHLEITDQHLMRRGVDMREKTFGDAVLAMVDKYLEFVPDDPSAQGLMEMLTGEPPLRTAPSVKPEPMRVLDEDGEDPMPTEEDEPDLRAKAEALGIDVDGRWGDVRLREEIAKAQG